MKVVKATIKNAEDIAYIEFNSGYFWSKYSLKKEIKFATKMLKEGKENVFLIKDKNKFIAYISICIKDSIGELGMSVLKNHQKKGVGSYAMNFIIEFAKKNGCKKLKGDVWEGNTGVIKLNQKFGFKTKSEKKNFYDNGDSLLYMELNL